MKKKIRKKTIIIAILIISLGIFMYSIWQIFLWVDDNKKTEIILEDIYKKVEITEIKLDSTPKEEETLEKEEYDPYKEFISVNLMDVNIDILKEDNEEIIGWIKVLNTNINYPFVQTTDNKYYLTHDLYKNNNGGGWVYLDYRNPNDLTHKNNILYGHGRENNTMFGTLKNVLKDDWLNNKENHIIKTSTLYSNSLWQVFSVYKIPNTNDYIQTNFEDDEDYKEFLKMIHERSIFDFQNTVDIHDKILTLSTCFNDDIKVVLHAKLIENSLKE